MKCLVKNSLRSKHFVMKNMLLIWVLLPIISNAQQGTHFNFGGEMDRIDCGNSSSLQITGNQITLEAYVKFNTFQDQPFKGTIINKEQNTSDNGYMLRIGGNGIINFNLGNGQWHELNSPSNAISLGLWYHVAATYDGATMKIYVNGNLIAQQNEVLNIANASNNLFIADWYDWLFPSTARNVDAQIDEIRVWNIARTANQINLSYGCELTGNETGLVLYYKFNQGIAGGTNTSERIIIDSSPFSNNGQLYSSSLIGTNSNFLSGSAVDTGTNCSLLSANFNTDSIIEVYPNPTNSFLYLKAKSNKIISKLEVFDLSGKLILINHNYNEKIDVSHFLSGIYILKIFCGDSIVNKKFRKR